MWKVIYHNIKKGKENQTPALCSHEFAATVASKANFT